MARQVHEREDLLRDATALAPRVQLRLNSGEVFAGFRSGDALSLYFDTSPVYHFNSRGELRRAFVEDRLLKAERGRLVALQPQRGVDSTELLRHELTPAEAEHFLRTLAEHLGRLRRTLDGGQYAVEGQVPTDGDALPRLVRWLSEFEALRIAASPRVRD